VWGYCHHEVFGAYMGRMATFKRKMGGKVYRFTDGFYYGFIVGIFVGMPVGVVLLMWAMSDPL
jgi:tetrahydromethanopterin S-methyltransferase subunit A